LDYAASETRSTSGCVLTVLRTFTVSDDATNRASCTQTITVQDTIPPVLACPGNVDAKLGDPVSITPPTATDNCSGALVSTCVRSDGKPLTDPFPLGTTTVTCSCADACQNPASCSFAVNVINPNLPPNCVAKITPSDCGVTFPSNGKLFTIAVENDYVCLTLDGSGSTDPDGDALTTSWVTDGTNILAGTVVTNCLDVGCHTITMVTSDGRANCHQFLDICVITASEACEQLITVVENTQVERKNKRPLIVSLKAAKAAFERDGWKVGELMLRVFEYKVSAQIARHNPAEAAMFIDSAQHIISALECVVKQPRRHHGDHDDDHDGHHDRD